MKNRMMNNSRGKRPYTERDRLMALNEIRYYEKHNKFTGSKTYGAMLGRKIIKSKRISPDTYNRLKSRLIQSFLRK